MEKRCGISARLLPAILILAVLVAPAHAASYIEATASTVTTTTTLSGSSSSSSATYYGAHLRMDASVTPWGIDLRYVTASQGGGSDNDYVAFLTYRFALPLATLRFGVGLEGENATAFGSGYSFSGNQSSPILGVMADFSAGPAVPGFSVEAGVAYAPAITGTVTLSVSGGGTASGTVTGTESLWYVGFRYTAPGVLGLTLGGGYSFAQANTTISGTASSTSSSGPYLNIGIKL